MYFFAPIFRYYVFGFPIKKKKEPLEAYRFPLFMFNHILTLKQPISRNILNPFSAAVVMDDHGPFDKFIRAEQEIDYEHGQLPYKSSDKAKRNCIDPHGDGVADKAEAAVAACTKDTGNQSCVDSSTHDVIGVDQQHIFHIMQN